MHDGDDGFASLLLDDKEETDQSHTVSIRRTKSFGSNATRMDHYRSNFVRFNLDDVRKDESITVKLIHAVPSDTEGACFDQEEKNAHLVLGQASVEISKL